MKTLGDIRELRDGSRWLIKLRMIAVVCVVLIAFTTEYYLKLDVHVPGLCGVSLFLLLYNILFIVLLSRWRGILAARIIANAQIFLDFVTLTLLLHFSGGIGNPFFFYYVFHTIVSAILLSRWEATIQTLLAIAMFSALVLLETAGTIPHYHLGILPMNFVEAPLFIAGTFFVLVSTLLLALYTTITISERSRQKNLELSSIREELTRRELPRSEEEILRAEKLSSLGKMAAGIAHEINNPLTIVLTNVEMAIDELQPDDAARESLEIVKEEVIRCRDIIGKLLTFSRGEEIGRRLCDAAGMFEDSIALMQNYAALNQVRIEAEIPREKVFCRINENQMKQVLINVMMNGIQSMPEGGRLGLELAERNEQFIEFVVEDSGRGIPRGLLSKIFDPFYTTKRIGEGTGLGLAISHRLVELHNGVIDIKSTEGTGTRVTIRLPKGAEKRTGGAPPHPQGEE